MSKFRMITEKDGYKPGDHILRIPGKPVQTVKAGDIIECDAEDLKGVMHKFELVGLEIDDTPNLSTPLKAIQRDGSPWWDVVNTVTGKPINTKGLKKEIALEMVDEDKASHPGNYLDLKTPETNSPAPGEDDSNINA